MVHYLPFLPQSQFLKLKAPRQPELLITMDSVFLRRPLAAVCSISFFYLDNRHLTISKHTSKKILLDHILFI